MGFGHVVVVVRKERREHEVMSFGLLERLRNRNKPLTFYSFS
jgi:hypothetical protein